MSLDEYISNNLGAIAKSDFYINRFNERVNKFHDNTKDFIYLHYLTKRNDSEFWKTFKDKNTITENIQKYLDQCSVTMPDRKFIKTMNDAYDVSSFYAVTQGVHLFNNKKAF